MAHLAKQNSRLIQLGVLFFAVIVLALVLTEESADALAKGRHYLSWESRGRSQQMRRYAHQRLSLYRYKVSRDKIKKLKKASFWNKRPYQFSTPVISEGILYVGVDASRFYAIDASREKKIWEFETEGPVQGKAAITDGTVYFGDSKTFIYALDAATGEEKWRSRLDNEILATPLVSGGRVYVADMTGRLYALDRATGSQIWHTSSSDRNIGFSIRRASSPVEVGGMIVVGTATGSVVAYRLGDGSVAWIRQIGDRQSQVYDVDAMPLVSGGRIYVSSADGALAAIDASSGQVLWVTDGGGPNDLLLVDDRIFAASGGVLTSIDANSGSTLWQQDFKTPEISSPVANDHYVAVVSTTDKFYLVDRETGDVVYDRFVRRGALGDPIVDGDHIYLLSNSSALWSFKVRELPPKVKKQESSKKAEEGGK